MKHLKTWLVEKEFDKELNSTERIKVIALGYNTREKAQEFCVILNKECKNCPRRAALHTTYKVLEPAIHIRILTADDTYKEKMQGQ